MRLRRSIKLKSLAFSTGGAVNKYQLVGTAHGWERLSDIEALFQGIPTRSGLDAAGFRYLVVDAARKQVLQQAAESKQRIVQIRPAADSAVASA